MSSSLYLDSLITGYFREKATRNDIYSRILRPANATDLPPRHPRSGIDRCSESSSLWVPERAIATLWDAVWAFFFLSTGTLRRSEPTTSMQPTQSRPSSSTGRCRLRSSSTSCGLGCSYSHGGSPRDGPGSRCAGGLNAPFSSSSHLHDRSCLAGVVSVAHNGQSNSGVLLNLHRAFELGAGALLAIVASRISPGRMTRAVMLYIGVLVIAAGALLLGPASPFPGLLAMIPVAGTLMVIASGIGSYAPGQALLANPVAGFLGRISYSLYLWHWPLIILTFSVVDQSWWTDLIVLEAVFPSSPLFPYSFVEVPVRRPLAFRPGLASGASHSGPLSHPTNRRDRRQQRAVVLSVGVIIAAGRLLRPHLYVPVRTGTPMWHQCKRRCLPLRRRPRSRAMVPRKA